MANCYCEDSSLFTVADAGYGGYTSLITRRDENGNFILTASGEGSANLIPRYCPFCGRKMRQESLGQFKSNGYFKPVFIELKYPNGVPHDDDEDEEDD